MMLPILLFTFGFAGVFIAGGLVCYAWQRGRRGPVQTPALCFVRTWRPLTPEEWAAAFRGWSDSDPRWRALWDLLAHHLEAELGEAQGAPADSHAIAQRIGRVQTILFLRAQILHLRNS